MRVLADTNIVFSAIIRPNSVPAQALLKITEKYHLINDFEADYREGRKDENYAKKVGLIMVAEGQR